MTPIGVLLPGMVLAGPMGLGDGVAIEVLMTDPATAEFGFGLDTVFRRWLVGHAHFFLPMD